MELWHGKSIWLLSFPGNTRKWQETNKIVGYITQEAKKKILFSKSIVTKVLQKRIRFQFMTWKNFLKCMNSIGEELSDLSSRPFCLCFMMNYIYFHGLRELTGLWNLCIVYDDL